MQEGSPVAKASLLEEVRADAFAAIDRLLAGTPQHPKVQDAALKGKLQINPSTVALECGRSRTYFGFSGCALPDVRQRILELKTTTGRAAALGKLAVALHARVRELEAALKVRDSAVVALQVALIQARGQQGSRGSSNVVDYRARRKEQIRR